MTTHNEHKLISMADALKNNPTKSRYKKLTNYLFGITPLDIALYVEDTKKNWEWYTTSPKWYRNTMDDEVLPNKEFAKSYFGVELFNTGVWYWFDSDVEKGDFTFAERYSQRTGKSDGVGSMPHRTKIRVLMLIKEIGQEAFDYAVRILGDYNHIIREE